MWIAVIIILLREVEQWDVFYQDEISYLYGICTFIAVNKTDSFGQMLYISTACYKLSVLKIMFQECIIYKMRVYKSTKTAVSYWLKSVLHSYFIIIKD